MAASSPRRRTPDRARRLAFDVLRSVHADGAYANLALGQLLAGRGLTSQDAAFATELVAGTCRREGTYDAILVAAGGRALNTLQPAVVDLLRLGAHQILALRVPSHAAVAAMVDLAGATVGERVTGLVNAVLRRVAAREEDAWLEQLSQGLDERDRLALITAHPRWIVDAYAAQLPPDELSPALLADNVSPAVTLTVRPGLAAVGELIEGGARPGRWSPYAATWTGDPAGLPAVREGRAGVQDEGSQLAALGLARAAAASGPWLDLCAGPGGKTALLTGLAAATGERLLAVEPAPHRAQLVAGAVRAYPASQIPTVVVADGTRPPWSPGTFGRVLADVPCSGTGSLRRRPESRWRRTGAEVEELHALQLRLLATALDAVVPGGVVAYVTCSPVRRETVEVVAETLQAYPGVETLSAAELLPEVTTGSAGTHLQLWPHRDGTDAIFAAYLRRS